MALASLLAPLDREEPASDHGAEELARIREVLGEHEAELVVWKARAEAAEAALALWETRENRSLWRILTALDHLRLRVAPPGTRREAGARTGARLIAHGLAGRRRRRGETSKSASSGGEKPVLFVADKDTADKRYRCDHLREQLSFLGVTADFRYTKDIDLGSSAKMDLSMSLNSRKSK